MESSHVHQGVLGSWRLRAKAVVTVFLAAAGLSLILSIGLLIEVWRDVQSPPEYVSSLSWALHRLLIGVFLVTGAGTGWLFLRYLKLPWLVAQHEGQVCPMCVKPMQRIEGQAGPDALMTCPSCGVEFNRLGLRAYWSGFPNPAWVWKQWYFQRARPRSRVHAAWLRVRRPLHAYPRHMYMLGSLVSAAPAVGIFLFVGPPLTSDPVYLLFRFLPVILIASWFIAYPCAIECVREEQPQCKRCQYHKHGGIDASPLCPECGHNWNAIGGTHYVAYRTKPMIIAVFTVALVLGMALSMMSTSHNLPQRYASTDALIDVLIESDRAISEWNELRQNRELTPSQLNRFVDTLLDKRDAGEPLSTLAAIWLGDQLTADLLSPEQRERHFSGMHVMWLEGPQVIRTGERTEITVVNDRRSNALSGVTYVYFGGFYVDGSPEPVGRGEMAVPAASFARLLNPPERSSRGVAPFHTRFELHGESPGEMTVTAEYWLVVRPYQTRPGAIAWNDDGTAQLPEDALWVGHERLEHRVLVVEE